MSCMKETLAANVDQEKEEDWEIGLLTSTKQVLTHLPADCNYGGEEEDDDEYDDDDDDDDDYDDEELDYGNYAGNVEMGCPYCVENFDILGLCCHIDDQHYKEAKSGICPICDRTLDTNMTVHIIAQHESMLRALRKVHVRSGGTRTGISRLKKEDYVCSNVTVSPPVGSSDLSPDPLFLSFAKTPSLAYKPESLQPKSPSKTSSSRMTSNCDPIVRSIEPSSLTDKSRDKAQVREFVSDLVFSTMFDDL